MEGVGVNLRSKNLGQINDRTNYCGGNGYDHNCPCRNIFYKTDFLVEFGLNEVRHFFDRRVKPLYTHNYGYGENLHDPFHTRNLKIETRRCHHDRYKNLHFDACLGSYQKKGSAQCEAHTFYPVP